MPEQSPKRPAHFRFSADRQSAQRRVRYQEGTLGDPDDCQLCQLEQATSLENSAMHTEPHAPHDDDDDEEQFTAAMLAEAVENQLAAGKPPAAQASFNKLSLVGYAREEIIELMSQVLAYSIKQMLDSGQPFDMPGYERLLRELPTLPELADEATQ